jgi:uncharacterized protein (TIGR02118 family)
MIKLVICLRRKQGMSVEAFNEHWREIHGPLVREVATTMGICRYVQNKAQQPGMLEPVMQMLGYGGLPYDGLAELWCESVEGFAAALMTDEGQAAGARVSEDGTHFIDLAASTAFIVEEVEIVGNG